MESLLAVIGFAAQWLRAQPWFKDWMLFIGSIFFGLLMMAKQGAPVLHGGANDFTGVLVWIADFIGALGTNVMTLLGGTFVASQASHLPQSIVPKFNAAAPKGTPGSPGTPEHSARAEYKK